MLMQKDTRNHPSAVKKIASGIVIAAAVFVGLIFLCVCFDSSSSSGMVDGDINLILSVVAGGTSIVCMILWINGRRRGVFIGGAAALFVSTGTFLIPNTFSGTASAFMLFGVAVCLLIAVFSYAEKQLTVRRAAFLIIAVGCVMRIGVAMAIPANFATHDYLFGTDFASSSGHASYIGYIAENFALPDSYSGQYYHPPLHHILGAVFYLLCTDLGFTFERFAESFQILTATYSCLMLVTWYKILSHFDLRKSALLASLSLIALHPTGWIMGANLNNDILMYLLVSVCILYLIKWYAEPTYKNIVIMAVTLGLAMMTKVSAVLVAPAILVVFLYKLLQERNLAGKSRFSQMVVFGCLSVPLGIWYPLRNLIKFGQSFGYVPLLPETYTQYLGNMSFARRTFGLSLDLFESPFVQWEGVDYNFFIKVQKTALFGEVQWLTDLDPYGIAAGLLTIVNYVLVAISLGSIIFVLVKMPRGGKYVLFASMGVYYLSLTLSHFYFSYLYAFQCTNDIRYVAINICIGALFIGKMMALKGRRRALKKEHTPVVMPLIWLFCCLSCMIFILDSFYRVF